jgi:hypothetical protein
MVVSLTVEFKNGEKEKVSYEIENRFHNAQGLYTGGNQPVKREDRSLCDRGHLELNRLGGRA